MHHLILSRLAVILHTLSHLYPMLESRVSLLIIPYMHRERLILHVTSSLYSYHHPPFIIYIRLFSLARGDETEPAYANLDLIEDFNETLSNSPFWAFFSAYVSFSLLYRKKISNT